MMGDYLSSLGEIINGLNTSNGTDYNKWVAKAFNFLFYDATAIEATEAESDVIAESLISEEPYYIVIEAQAVLAGNEVGYTKLGQIRGNFPSYMDQRRQKLFKNAYKLVVGRPKFSADAKKRSEPDVLLLKNDTLIQLLTYHDKFSFSQDYLEVLFRKDKKIAFGEIDEVIINRLLYTFYKRKIEINALILYCLGIDSNRRDWTPIQQVIGMAKAYGKLLKLNVDDKELNDALNDLQSIFCKLVDNKEDRIRLNSIPLNHIKYLFKSGNELTKSINEFSERIKGIELK
jgi:hypothetical protein